MSGKGGSCDPGLLLPPLNSQSHFFDSEIRPFKAKPSLFAKPSVKYWGNVQSEQHIYPFKANYRFGSNQALFCCDLFL